MKDLATHTPGTVVQPGTILMTPVPVQEKLRAEVYVRNEDIGNLRQRKTSAVQGHYFRAACGRWPDRQKNACCRHDRERGN